MPERWPPGKKGALPKQRTEKAGKYHTIAAVMMAIL